ncbi:MAG: nucleoside-diphosphate sugar epimerase/dehydratase [Clostridia bacterium]|nr:nucleoside-diphosphate sugar epimerase/dehydratase [Clostridia bacterium]
MPKGKLFFEKLKSIKSRFIISDFFALILSAFLSAILDMRFEFSFFSENLWKIAVFIVCDFIFMFIIFNVFKIYQRVWRVLSGEDYINLTLALIVSKFAVFSVSSLIFISLRKADLFVWSVKYLLFSFLLILISRYLFFLIFNANKRKDFIPGRHLKVKKIIVIGAGNAGKILIEEIKNKTQETDKRVVAIFDDDETKTNRYLSGVRIVGTVKDVPNFVMREGIDEIYIAIPSASTEDKKRIIETCNQTSAKVKILPGVVVFDDGNLFYRLRDINYEDLLGRQVIKPDLSEVFESFRDKVILVTGAGGSIGSEICRQIGANANVKALVLLDICENTVYDIQLELKAKHPNLDVRTIIGSITDYNFLEDIFEYYKINIVFHAAAHKHVPLMEHNIKEAYKNNVFGTMNLAHLADKYNVEKFLMISTDKAVNPTNIMGATKAVCERVVQCYNQNSDTHFLCVRFGNVLGSAGSVIPIFKKQIEEGGPVTVTSKDIERYFMLIPEAVSLVLKSMSYTDKGDLFVLDMGTPVNIYNMAQKMVDIYYKSTGQKVEIEIMGLREGEKMTEELFSHNKDETIEKIEKMFVAKRKDIDCNSYMGVIKKSKEDIESLDTDDIILKLEKLVPGFKHERKYIRKDI